MISLAHLLSVLTGSGIFIGIQQTPDTTSTKKEVEKDFSLTDAPVRKVDHRLPYDNYRQVFNTRNSWKAVCRNMETIAKDTLVRLFREHPDYQKTHTNPEVRKLVNEEDMLDSEEFEGAAMAVFNLIDRVMENLESVDEAILDLEQAGAVHARIPNFNETYFSDYEKCFFDAVSAALYDRFTDQTETNFRHFWVFMLTHMNNGYLCATALDPSKI